MLAVPHDFETCSEADLKASGVDVYGEHPSTRVLCLAYKINGKRHMWLPGGPDPQPLLDHIAAGGQLTAWNAPFEMAIWHHVIRRDYPNWPQPKLEQVSCTMARALALALPGSLDKCGEALRLDIRKDKAGHRLMMQMCRPLAPWRKWEAAGRQGAEPQKWKHEPEMLQKLGAYCQQDVDAEEAIGEKVAPLTAAERELWCLDQKINRRGVRLDTVSVQAAYEIAAAEKRKLDAQMRAVTGGYVPKVSNTKKLLEWLSDELHPLPDLKKRTVGVALSQGINNEAVTKALQLRQQGSKASVAKLKAMLRSVSRDGRARGLFGYHTATTGRWASRRIQAQNFYRPALSHEEIEGVFSLLPVRNAADCIRFSYADPIEAIASSLRGMIVPSPGRKFVGGDLANIEGRVLAWLAGEDWKLQAFLDYDLGIGLDLYIQSYARSFGLDPTTIGKKDPRRQVGKVQELALGYMGGPFAFVAMALNYPDVNIGDVARIVYGITPPGDWEEALEKAHKQTDLRGLTPFVWAGLRIVVDAWRDAHPAIRAFWYDLEECAVNATLNKGKIFSTKTRRVKYLATDHFLYAQLPSNRCLAYAKPSVDFVPKPSGKGTKAQLSYWGVGKKTKKWEKRKAYGGLFAEQATQGTSRDVLVSAMHRAEARGYPIVLHVHDELLAEVRADFGSSSEFNNILTTPEQWMSGLPLAAQSEESHRFGK